MGRVSAHAGRAWWLPIADDRTARGLPTHTLTSNEGDAWNLSYGWTYGESENYRKFGGGENPNLQLASRTGLDGSNIEVYVDTSFDKNNAIGFHPRGETKALAFAEDAFDRSKPDHAAIFDTHEICGGDLEGHIKRLEYSQQVLRVTFANGGVCLFFRIPNAVAGTLFKLARDGQAYTDRFRKTRHLLGRKFWQMIRIPGHHTGAKYNFEYEKHGHAKVIGSGKRYFITLTAKNIEAVTGNKLPGAKEGDMVQTVLSEQELLDLWEKEKNASEEDRRTGNFMLSQAERNELEKLIQTAGKRYARISKDFTDALDVYESIRQHDKGYIDAYKAIMQESEDGDNLSRLKQKRLTDALIVLPETAEIIRKVEEKIKAEGKDALGLNQKEIDFLKHALEAGALPELKGLRLSDIRNEITTNEYTDNNIYNKNYVRYIDEDGKMRYKRITAFGRTNPKTFFMKNVNMEPDARLLDDSQKQRLYEIRAKKQQTAIARGMAGDAWTPSRMRELSKQLTDAAAGEFKYNLSRGDYERALECLRHMKRRVEIVSDDGKSEKVIRPFATDLSYFINDEE